MIEVSSGTISMIPAGPLSRISLETLCTRKLRSKLISSPSSISMKRSPPGLKTGSAKIMGAPPRLPASAGHGAA